VSALVWSGTEVIFSLVAQVVLCFWFVTRTVITQGCFVIAEQCPHSIKAFFVSCTTLSERRLGVHKQQGEDTTGTADPN